jgi:hypothetical protein
MKDKLANWLAVGILGTMFILLLTSSWNDSATMDELAHIPAAYSYLTERDYRLNPEHPPLIKDLAALPLLFLNLNFPTNVKAWTDKINGQWEMGSIFLYQSGNNADRIIRLARLPIMLLAILFGWLFFKWASSLYGDKVGLLALFLFAFSPTFLAHSKYVTTDLGAAFGFFIGIAAFLNFLSKNDSKSLIIAGLAFGVAQLLKFSLVILGPLYLLLGILWVLLQNYENFKWTKVVKEKFLMVGKVALIGLIGLLLIWSFYLFHTWNYPAEKQLTDTQHLLSTFGFRMPAEIVIRIADTPVLRALGHYWLGILMVIQRAGGGNTTAFLGEISSIGWPSYFPLLYLLKEHLALHILTFIALFFGIRKILKSRNNTLGNFASWLKENFALTASFIFIGIYWLQAISSPLNLGIRHVMPTFPFIYLLVSREIIRWISSYPVEVPRTFGQWLKNLYCLYIRPLKRGLLAAILLLWLFVSALIAFPHYLPYYNGLAGGTPEGHKIAVDSNYDWGQDLKRLRNWVNKNIPTEKIAIDYFGGGNPAYYLEGQYIPWWSSKGKPPNETWLAVSATFLENARAKPVKGFVKKAEDSYPWLANKKPFTRAGSSIFIFKF